MKIEIKNVSKSFHNTEVLSNVNITFKPGNIYGFIGRNGSGKSVLLKIICGFFKPTSGVVLFDGEDIIQSNLFPPDTRALIEKPTFMPQLSGYENLKLLAAIQGKISDKEIMCALEEVSLLEEKDKIFSKYSLGMKQKLGIAQVLMEDPKVMIFDEPFNGIEEGTAKKLRKLFQKIKKDKIIIIASHIKEDIDELADEVYHFDASKVSKLMVKDK